MYGPYGFTIDWLIDKLLDDGAEMKFLGEYGSPHDNSILLEVTPATKPRTLGTADVRTITSLGH